MQLFPSQPLLDVSAAGALFLVLFLFVMIVLVVSIAQLSRERNKAFSVLLNISRSLANALKGSAISQFATFLRRSVGTHG